MGVRGKWCRRKELNFRPRPYQGRALPLSYGGAGDLPLYSAHAPYWEEGGGGHFEVRDHEIAAKGP